MKEFVRRDKPEGYATFTASDRWRIRFFTRFRLNAMDGSEDKLIQVEGCPEYSLNGPSKRVDIDSE